MTFNISDEVIVSLVDLTHLQTNDQEAKIIEFCKQAITPLGNVAGICVLPEWLEIVEKQKVDKNIKIGTVANFPSGDVPIDNVLASVKTSIMNGAQEIDVVIPYTEYINGHTMRTKELLKKCRAICEPPIILKAILETGALRTETLIKSACRDAVLSGVDFVKTSTGKTPIGITEEALVWILEEIVNLKKYVGIKISGGIQTREQVLTYLELIADIIDEDYIAPETCRIGTSRLLKHILSD